MAEALFTCESCGKQYRWKSELAGKRVKCKCGTIVHVPLTAPDEDQGLYGFADDDSPPSRLSAATGIAAVSRPAASSGSGVASSDYRCPSCGQSLEPGVVLCPGCGFNLKTGEKAALRPAAAARGAVGAPVGQYYHARPIQVAEDSAGAATKPLIALGVLLLLVGAVAGFRFLLQTEEAPQLGEDAQVLKLIKDHGATEVIDWLNGSPRRIVMGMTPHQAEQQAVKLYDMGAKQVLAFGQGMTRSLAVELPDDPQQRKALFDWEHQWHSEMFVEPAKDVGQKYLLLRMRL